MKSQDILKKPALWLSTNLEMNQISNETPSREFRIIPKFQFPNPPKNLWVECPGYEAGRFGVEI
jgi:hypothetical protein